MIIRRASIDDLPELMRLGELMRQESESAFPPIDPAYTRQVAELTFNLPEYAVFVADDGCLIGMITCMISGYVFSPVKIATTDLFFVQPDRRGLKAAKMLLKAYTTWADERGIQDKRIGVSTKKDIAPLMKHFGFDPVGMNFRRLG